MAEGEQVLFLLFVYLFVCFLRKTPQGEYQEPNSVRGVHRWSRDSVTGLMLRRGGLVLTMGD